MSGKLLTLYPVTRNFRLLMQFCRDLNHYVAHLRCSEPALAVLD